MDSVAKFRAVQFRPWPHEHAQEQGQVTRARHVWREPSQHRTGYWVVAKLSHVNDAIKEPHVDGCGRARGELGAVAW